MKVKSKDQERFHALCYTTAFYTFNLMGGGGGGGGVKAKIRFCCQILGSGYFYYSDSYSHQTLIFE